MSRRRIWMILTGIAAVIVLVGVIRSVNLRDEASYQAGYEDGARFAKLQVTLSGGGLSSIAINANCLSMTQLEVNRGFTFWSGGKLDGKDFDRDDYQQGCRDAVTSTMAKA
jgi:hypothetical protein